MPGIAGAPPLENLIAFDTIVQVDPRFGVYLWRPTRNSPPLLPPEVTWCGGWIRPGDSSVFFPIEPNGPGIEGIELFSSPLLSTINLQGGPVPNFQQPEGPDFDQRGTDGPPAPITAELNRTFTESIALGWNAGEVDTQGWTWAGGTNRDCS